MTVSQLKFYKTAYSMLIGSGLTMGQPKILDYLSNHDGSLQKDIAVGCCIDPATVTSLLLRMEEAGLIDRRSQFGDKRSHIVYLTAKGKMLQSRVCSVFAEVEELAFRGFSDEEKSVYLSMLGRIHGNLCKCENRNGKNSEREISTE